MCQNDRLFLSAPITENWEIGERDKRGERRLIFDSTILCTSFGKMSAHVS